MRREVLSGILLVCLVLGAIPINSAEETQVTNVKKWSENGHYYELIKRDVNWNEAKEYAEKREFEKNGVVYKGYLATLTSQEENSWVVENLVSPTGKGDVYPWLGGYQVQGYNNPSEGWKWVTGEDWSWTNWNEGEPNDLFGRSNERYLKMYPSGKWNDESIDGEPGWENYILIEYQPAEEQSAPQAIRVAPSSSTVSVVQGEKQTFRIKATDEDGDLYMVQWEVNGEWKETDSLATLNAPNIEGSADFSYTFEESSTVKAIVYDEQMNTDSIIWDVEVTTTPTPTEIPKIAEYYAPIIYQDVADDNPRADYITKFNYDGDWIGNNNWDNLENYKLLPYVYYSVVESENHWFICYAIFHPRDTQLWHNLDLLKHENDMEGLLMVVEKDGTKYGRLCCLVTVAHLDFFSFVVPDSDIEGNEEDIDGKISFEGSHPRIYVQAKGHGVFGSPGNYYNKNPTGPIHIGKWESGFPTGPLGGYGGIVYYPGDKAEEPSLDTLKKGNAQRVSYKLISIDQLWERRFDIGEGKTFDDYGTFDGDCGGMDPTCSEDAAHAPWAWDDTGSPISSPDNVVSGVIFTDPIKLVSAYFKGVVTKEEKYINNPYKTQTTPADITWKTQTIYSPDEGRIRIVDGPSEDYVYATFIWHEKPDTPMWFDAIDFEVRGDYEVIEPEFPNKNPSAVGYSNLPCPEGKESRVILYTVLNNLYGVGEEIAEKIGGWGIDPEPEVDYPSFDGVLYEEDRTDISIKFDPSLIEEGKEYYVMFPVKIKKNGDIVLEFELKDYYHIPIEHESLKIPMHKGEEIIIDIKEEEQNFPSYEEPKMITTIEEINSGTFKFGDEEIPYLSVIVENSLSPPGCQNAVGTCIPTTEKMEIVMIEKTPPPSFTAVTDYPKRKSYDVDFSIEKPINRIVGGEKSQEAEEAKNVLIIELASLPSGEILSTGQQIVYGLTQSILLDIANEEDISWKNFLSVILFVDKLEKIGLIEIENYYVPTGFERSYIEVYVKAQNGKPVEGAKVSTQICYLRGCEIKTEYTDAEGYCMFSAIPLSEYQPGKKYIITVEKEGYKKQEKNVKTKERVTFYLGGETVIDKPDLTIPSFSWSPEEPEEGAEVTFSYTIKNHGAGKAGASKTALFIDGEKVCEDGVNSLDSGSDSRETFGYRWKATAGAHEIRVVADCKGDVEESNEGNNEMSGILLTGEEDITKLIDEFIVWWNENKGELFKAAHEFIDEIFKAIDELISEYKKEK